MFEPTAQDVANNAIESWERWMDGVRLSTPTEDVEDVAHESFGHYLIQALRESGFVVCRADNPTPQDTPDEIDPMVAELIALVSLIYSTRKEDAPDEIKTMWSGNAESLALQITSRLRDRADDGDTYKGENEPLDEQAWDMTKGDFR